MPAGASAAKRRDGAPVSRLVGPLRMPGGTLAALLLLAVIVVSGALLGRQVPLEAFGARLEGRGTSGIALFVALGVLGTAVGLPRQALAFVGGLTWGTVAGLSLSLAAAVGGCALTLWISTRLLRDRVARRHPRFVAALARLLEHDAFAKIVALRLQPLGTNLLTNLCAGLTPLSRRTFLAASLVGYVPQMLVFALLGSGLRVGSGERLLASGALLLLSLALGAWVWRRHLARARRRAVGEDADTV